MEESNGCAHWLIMVPLIVFLIGALN